MELGVGVTIILGSKNRYVCVHSKLHKITLVATKVNVMLRSFVVLTWLLDKERINIRCDIME